MTDLAHFLHHQSTHSVSISTNQEGKLWRTIWKDENGRKQLTLQVAIIVLVCVVILCLVLIFVATEKKYNPQTKEHVTYLIQQASQWNSLSKQDTNWLIKWQHMNYAVSCLRMAKRMYSNEDIERITGCNIQEMCTLFEQEENQILSQIVQQSPQYQPKGDYVSYSGWV